jgi:hypothetical protein
MTFMSGQDNASAGSNADTATFGSDGELQIIAQMLIATLTPPDIATLVANLLTPYDIAPHGGGSSMVASNTNHGSIAGEVRAKSTGNSDAMAPSVEDRVHTLMLPH